VLSGIYGFTNGFLADLNNTEQRISQDTQDLSSGTRVNVASDNPWAVTPLIDDQNQIDQLTQLVTNLNAQQTIAQTADGALQSASGLMNQLISIATQGVTATATASSRAVLGQQVQQIEQQLVTIANTTVRGAYIFGGDSSSIQPYTYDWTNAPGAVSGGTASNTASIQGMDGSSIIPGLTAGQIFDAQQNGSPAPGNVFQAAYQLGTALLANNDAGVQSALASIQSAASYLSQCSMTYGNTENWITQQISTAKSTSTNLTDEMSTLRDTDVAAAATDLSQNQVALQAALAAQGNLPTKTLFSYFG
jgi:flagellar hook-associated protein 3 FlgL